MIEALKQERTSLGLQLEQVEREYRAGQASLEEIKTRRTNIIEAWNAIDRAIKALSTMEGPVIGRG